MEIKSQIITNSQTTDNKVKNNSTDTTSSFADELGDLQNIKTATEEADCEKTITKDVEGQETTIKETKNIESKEVNTVESSINELNAVVHEVSQQETGRNNLHQKGEKVSNSVKNNNNADDNDKKGISLINNDFNIQEHKEVAPQVNINMGFSGDGQPFSSLMNNENQKENKQNILGYSKKDLAEEAAILSTMAENINIANQKQISQEQEYVINETESLKTKTVSKNNEFKNINTRTDVVIERRVKYDTVIMNKADVEVFANLVHNGFVDMNNLTSENVAKSVHISKTLADLLVKAKENNQPLRIDFDNDISVIIKISRDGKLSADFLPSSQIAEQYLKENLPLLKQRFDENNIKYGELNQKNNRNKEQQQENSKRKDK